MKIEPNKIGTIDGYSQAVCVAANFFFHLQSAVISAKHFEIELFTPDELQEVRNKVNAAVLLKLNDVWENFESANPRTPREDIEIKNDPGSISTKTG